jgi:hypothetical protein
MDYMANIIEKIVVERNKEMDKAILGEIQHIALKNRIETKILLNEKMVANALRKQIPAKVTHEATLYKCCTCPNCKNVVDDFEKWGEKTIRILYSYCYFCGQALDWDGEITR